MQAMILALKHDMLPKTADSLGIFLLSLDGAAIMKATRIDLPLTQHPSAGWLLSFFRRRGQSSEQCLAVSNPG